MEALDLSVKLATGDALIIVDVQNDFLPGGRLGVPHGDEVIPALNRHIAAFVREHLPIYATRDWHPPNHCSFQSQGGPWPSHCVTNTEGAAFARALELPASATIISKGNAPEKEAYSGFEGTDLGERLRQDGVRRLHVGGLATDYCVLNTVKDGLGQGFKVVLLKHAIRAVNVDPADGRKAEEEMERLGAVAVGSARTSE
jgi:nicotinamidase/pyrazinamidase